MTAIWGPSRPCRAKEVVFALLLPGHRVAPSMVVPYKRSNSTTPAGCASRGAGILAMPDRVDPCLWAPPYAPRLLV